MSQREIMTRLSIALVARMHRIGCLWWRTKCCNPFLPKEITPKAIDVIDGSRVFWVLQDGIPYRNETVIRNFAPTHLVKFLAAPRKEIRGQKRESAVRDHRDFRS